jgi:acyl-CoA dehydrogenase
MTDKLLEETLDRVLAEHSGPSDRQRAEAEGWLPACWDALAGAGLVWLGVGEAAGGSGGDIADAALLVRLAGAHAVPLPLAECALLGGWLAGEAGFTLPAGPVTAAVPRRGDHVTVDADGRLSGCLQRVPWGRRAAAVVAVARSPAGPMAVSVDPSTTAVTAGTNMAGEPRDRLDLDRVPVSPGCMAPVSDEVAGQLELRGALSRALLLAGAAGSASALTISYASVRHQFGRPIGTFQAVAQRMVRMASEAEAAMLAATVAAHRFAESGEGTDEVAATVALAKAAVTRSAAEVAAHAHQVHGAIGMTQEYPLHHFTRRIWAWSHEWGSERRWDARIGASVAASGAEALWPRVAAGLTAS